MALEGVLKELMQIKYTEGVQDQLMNKVPIRKRIERDFSKEGYDGSRVVDAIQLGRNSTGRWMKEQDPFPSAGSSTVKNTAIFCAWFRASGAVSYTTNVRTKIKAFAKALSTEIMAVKDDTANKMERVACMDGSGLLGKITVVSGTTFRIPATKAVRLEEGLPIQFWTFAGTTNFDLTTSNSMRANPSGQAYYTVASIDFDITNTVTDEFGHTGVPAALVTVEETLAAAIATNDYVVTAGALVVSGTQIFSTEPVGIGGIVGMSRNYSSTPYDTMNYGSTFQQQTDDPSPGATDDFHGVSPTTWPRWRPTGYNANEGTIKPQLFEKVFTAIKTRSGCDLDEISDIYVNSIQSEMWRRDRYSEERVYLSPESGTESGNRGMPSSKSERVYPTFAGIPIVDGRYFDDDKAYIVMKSYMRLMVLEPFQLWTLGDGGFHKAYNREPAIHFEWQGFEQMAAKRRNCHAVVYNLKNVVPGV